MNSRHETDRAPYSASLLQAAAALYGADVVAGLHRRAEDKGKGRPADFTTPPLSRTD